MREQIYFHILRVGTILIRNLIGRVWYRRLFSRSEECLAELLHLIPPLLLGKNLGKCDEGDVYFFEVGVRSFVEDFPEKDSACFIELVDLCSELREIVGKSHDIQWDFPREIKASVDRLRKERTV